MLFVYQPVAASLLMVSPQGRQVRKGFKGDVLGVLCAFAVNPLF
jgi:hypothetical protein